jgi:hypothetical protein
MDPCPACRVAFETGFAAALRFIESETGIEVSEEGIEPLAAITAREEGYEEFEEAIERVGV